MERTFEVPQPGHSNDYPESISGILGYILEYLLATQDSEASSLLMKLTFKDRREVKHACCLFQSNAFFTKLQRTMQGLTESFLSLESMYEGRL